MKSPFDRESWSTAEALAAIALEHGFKAAGDLYDDDTVGILERALPRMAESASTPLEVKQQRTVNWARAAKALSPTKWLQLRLHPMLWVRWAMSGAEVNRPEPFCTEFGNWYTRHIAHGELPVMRRYSTSRKRWHGQDLTDFGFERGHGDPVHWFILKEIRPGDLTARWEMKFFTRQIRSVAKGGNDREKSSSPVQPKQSRGKGIEAALTSALDHYCRSDEAKKTKVTKVHRPKLGVPAFQAPDIGREELIVLLCRRYSTLRENYKPSTVRAAMSGLVSCRPGRAPRVRGT